MSVNPNERRWAWQHQEKLVCSCVALTARCFILTMGASQGKCCCGELPRHWPRTDALGKDAVRWKTPLCSLCISTCRC